MGSWGGGGGERDERGTSERERERESDRRGEPYAPMCSLLPLPSLAADGPLKMDKRGWNATRIMFFVKR